MPGKPTLNCPRCGAELPMRNDACPACALDVTALQTFREWPDACYNAGRAAAREGRWIEAVRELSAAVTLDPADAEAWQALGKVYERMGRPEEARQCREKAAEATPATPDISQAFGASGAGPLGLMGGG